MLSVFLEWNKLKEKTNSLDSTSYGQRGNGHHSSHVRQTWRSRGTKKKKKKKTREGENALHRRAALTKKLPTRNNKRPGNKKQTKLKKNERSKFKYVASYQTFRCHYSRNGRRQERNSIPVTFISLFSFLFSFYSFIIYICASFSVLSSSIIQR